MSLSSDPKLHRPRSSKLEGRELPEREWIQNTRLAPDTVVVHAGCSPDEATGAILTPIYNSTTFVQPSVEDYMVKGFSYSRQDNPTVRSLEAKLAALEGGVDAVCVSSGMAATCTLLSAFLASGDHCILSNCSYGGTNRCARVHFSKYNIDFSFVDMSSMAAIRAAIKPTTKLIYSETPTNPILQLCDVQAISDLAKSKQILHACDSTFATPLITKPLELGADIVVHSVTKFFDGHNIGFGGALVVADPKHYETLSLYRNILGNNMTADVAFLVLQTTKTLHLRLQRQSETALAIAQFLEKHSAVDWVSYPGLDSHPQRELVKKQHLNGIGGSMVCFEVKGGVENGRKLMNVIRRPWSLCENLGACESIITCPAVFTHANMLAEDRKAVGITDGLVRVSCGVESAQDLITALDEALSTLQNK